MITRPGSRGLLGVPTLAQVAAQAVHIEYMEGIAITGLSGVVVGSAAADIAMTWPNGGFTDTNYIILKPQVTLAASLLGASVQTTIKSKTKTGCVITVTTSATLTLGNSTLSVLAMNGGA